MASLRSASVVALDLGCSPARLGPALEFCRKFVEDALLFAPRDEIVVVFAGTSGTQNPLNDGAQSGGRGRQFAHISVPCGLAAPTVDLLGLLTPTAPSLLGEHCEVDFLETLLVCEHLICRQAASRRYSKRVVYLLTDARVDVVRKSEMKALLESFWQYNVSLVVIGIDFSDAEEVGDFDDEGLFAVDDDNYYSDASLVSLSVKAQNERVLRIMCSSLGEFSVVLSLEEALESVGGLQRRTIIQRPLLKMVLSIGDVRLATQMFTKTQKDRLPAMKKMTAAGEDVNVKTVYVGLAGDAVELKNGDFAMGYKYGSTFIPCAPQVVESLKVKGARALDAVGFVPIEQVPVYMLLGGVKVITPISDDMTGARAFRCIVRAMAAANQAMIARFVRTNDADPLLGICVPSKSEQRDVLFFSLLPFAEDVCFFDFMDHEGTIHCGCDDGKAAETDEAEKLLESIVEEMTVGKDVLRPLNTFNPVTQQFYATVREKMNRCSDNAGGDEVVCQEEGLKCVVEGTDTKHEKKDEVFLPLLETLKTTSAAFGLPGNQLEPVLSGVRAKLEACRRAFAQVH